MIFWGDSSLQSIKLYCQSGSHVRKCELLLKLYFAILVRLEHGRTSVPSFTQLKVLIINETRYLTPSTTADDDGSGHTTNTHSCTTLNLKHPHPHSLSLYLTKSTILSHTDSVTRKNRQKSIKVGQKWFQ